MKKLLSILLTLVLALSLSLVMAAPVSALEGQLTYAKVTSLGQLIDDQSDPTALFKVEICMAQSDGELTSFRAEFENVSGFTQTDLDTVSIYRGGVYPAGEDMPGFDPSGDALIAAGAVTWIGLVAEVTFTESESLVWRGTSDLINYFWVAIETSATITNGDQFRATLGEFEIDGIWEGSDGNPTDIITAVAPLESNTTVGLIGEVEQITAINVEPTNIDFGTITPGTPKAGDNIYVENIGSVKVDVSASLDKSGTVFEYLELAEDSYSVWGIIGLEGGTTADPVSTLLNVPGGYSAKGVETNTLIFTARPY